MQHLAHRQAGGAGHHLARPGARVQLMLGARCWPDAAAHSRRGPRQGRKQPGLRCEQQEQFTAAHTSFKNTALHKADREQDAFTRIQTATPRGSQGGQSHRQQEARCMLKWALLCCTHVILIAGFLTFMKGIY